MAAFACSQAKASFELMYVADAGTTTKGIHRFDPVSGAYLGRFGQTSLINPRAVAVGPQGHVYVLDVAYTYTNFGSRVRVFNGSTGEIISSTAIDWSFAQNSKIAVDANGRVAVTSWDVYSAPYTLMYDPNGAYSGYFYGTTAGYAGAVAYMDSAAIFTSTSGVTVSASINPAPGTQLNVGPTFSFSGGANSVHMSVNGNRGLIGTGGVFSWFVRNGNALSQLAVGSVPGINSISGVGLGHANIGHAVGYSTAAPTDFRISSFDATTGDALGYVSYGSLLQNPVDAAIVVAPEPGTLAVIACGLAGIVKLRRNRKS